MSERGTARILARSPRGLEWVCAAEIRGKLGAEIVEVQHREVLFETPALTPGVLGLNTADDVFLACGLIQGIDHTRASLHSLSESATHVDFTDALARIGGIRDVVDQGRFDVVASFLGKRNYNRFEIEEAIGHVIAGQLGAEQQSHHHRADTDVSWRVHLRNGEAFVGLRIPPKPLHRRAYKTASQAGTLHPPVAAAMALLAGIRTGGVLLDPFCGFGTIAIEAARLEVQIGVCASDIDPAAVGIARDNAVRAIADVDFVVADAGDLPFAYRAFDRVVCNLPWGRAVVQRGALCADTGRFWQEMARVLHSEGRAVILSEVGEPTDGQLSAIGLSLVYRQGVRISGRWSVLSIIVPERSGNSEVVDQFGWLGADLDEALDRHCAVGDAGEATFGAVP